MKLDGKRIYKMVQFDRRKTARCRHCIGWTFNASKVCTACLDGIPVPPERILEANQIRENTTKVQNQ